MIVISQNCKAEMVSRQACLDFVNQSVDKVGIVEDAANRNERLILAERLGTLNLQWMVLLRKINDQVRSAASATIWVGGGNTDEIGFR